MNVVVNFKMRDMREDSAADLALVELFLARFYGTVRWVDLHILVYMFTVTFLVNHILPVRLEPFTAHLQFFFLVTDL